MKQYLIIAYDGIDAEASERRKKIRPFHLAGAKILKEKNQFITGGAILNNEEQMIGSAMIVQFETAEDFQEWYKNEPYIKEGVWQKIEVKPFRVAELT
jgi:uncharacterized protein YciI